MSEPLNGAPPTPEQFEAAMRRFFAVSKQFNSEITYIAGRDENDKLLFVGAYVTGPPAEDLFQWLEDRDPDV